MTDPKDTAAAPEPRDRYPGPRSYADDPVDEALFFGRDEEAEALLHRVRAHRSLVLFGRSGLGKTSLLQAGLYPRLRRRGLFPVTVRFDREDLGPVPTVVAAVEAACVALDWVRGDDSDLWTFFKTTDLWQGETLLRPVLVLDQFEEIFTLRDAAFRGALAAELRDLVETGPARALRRHRAAGELPAHGEEAPDLRLVLSLREEYLAALDELVSAVPSLLEQRFRLTPMTVERAAVAVREPAARELPEVRFRTRPFGYTEGALQAMMNELANDAGEVELIHLQILCGSVERQVAGRQAEHKERLDVDEALLGGEQAMQRVSTNFYRDVLRRLAWPLQRYPARRLCEQGLLSPKGHRVSMEEGQARRKYRVTKASLAKLVDSRLVRRDARPGLKGFYYELSHDSLARSVFKRRRSRLAKETAVGFTVLVVLFGSVIVYQRQRVEQAERIASKLSAAFRDPLRDGGEGPEMLVIPAGRFLMGCVSGNNCSDDELPVREVRIGRPFALGKFEVRVGEFRRFVEATTYVTEAERGSGCYSYANGRWTQDPEASWRHPGFEQTDGQPVVCLTWKDANQYAAWLSKQTGKTYRLPSEAEWEYAARAGATTAYWWGDRIGTNRANCDGCGSQWDGKQTAPVGSFPANPFGLHDTAGNVWEWTADCWNDGYQGAPADGSARVSGDCGRRVMRGGSWLPNRVGLRSANRFRFYTDAANFLIGFRLAQDL